MGNRSKDISMKFKIFYDGNYTCEEDAYNAPSLGVICILDCHDFTHLHESADYYVWKFREDGWTGVDLFGLWDYLQMPGYKKVLFGRTISNDDFKRIHEIAYQDLSKARKGASE
jgi:hypothetical protein